jgi:hypothetical protein
MKIPRFSISGLMAVVLIVALDFGACKALLGGPLFVPDLSDLIVFGALPMANILAIGLIPFLTARTHDGGRRPALVGFEVFGVVALLLYIGCSLLATRTIHDGVGDLLRAMHLQPEPVFLVGASALLTLPQVALAFLGGRLGGKYILGLKVVVEWRGLPEPEPEPGPVADRQVVAGGVLQCDVPGGQ